MTQLWTFDLGIASGIAYGEYSDTQPYEVIDVWQVTGGAVGLRDWFNDVYAWRNGPHERPAPDAIAVCEKFILNPGNEFQAELEGVIGEGVLLALWPGEDPIRWQPRSKKFMGYGETTTKRADEILKAGGLWMGTPEDHEDSRDVNDALIHALVYLRDQRHIPTMKRYLSQT